jgi:hypothetical protein
MKKLIIVLVASLFIGCSGEYENPGQEKPGVKKETLIYADSDSKIEIIRIGNHQYLKSYVWNGGSVCHYEDCDYCKEHRWKETSKK